MNEDLTGKPSASLDKKPLPLPAAADQKTMFRWFFFGFFAFLLFQLVLILSLFANVMIWACSLTLVFWPAYRLVKQLVPARPNISAAICTTGVLVLVLVPLITVFAVVIAQSAQLYPTMQRWLEVFQSPDSTALVTLLPTFLQESWQSLSQWLASIPVLASFDFGDLLLANADTLSSMLANFSAATARNILLGIINLALILILMYFCFRDGERFMRWFFEIIPMETRHVQDVTHKVYETVTAVIRGALVTATMQGALALIGYLIADVPLALFFGVLTGFAALIPVLGAALIWLPIGLFVLLETPGWGVFILLWGFFLVSLIDNLLKPIIIGNRTRMPILLIFCAMIGGANVYGVTGFIIGPILISVLLAFITIYREYYLRSL